MKGRRKRERPRLPFGCMAVAILAVVAVGAFVVVFLWDVNLR